MIKLVMRISAALGYILSYIYPRKLSRIIKLSLNALYSGWLRSAFKDVGTDFFIHYPMVYVGLKHVTIGNNFSCFANLRLEAFERHLENRYQPKIIIGDNVSINYNCHIACVNSIKIGNNVLIASNVFITDHFHGEITKSSASQAPALRKVQSKGEVVIKDNVWIGEGVAIMPGITINENCIIGANTVLTKSFPANSVIAGNPGRLIKTLS